MQSSGLDDEGYIWKKIRDGINKMLINEGHCGSDFCFLSSYVTGVGSGGGGGGGKGGMCPPLF